MSLLRAGAALPLSLLRAVSQRRRLAGPGPWRLAVLMLLLAAAAVVLRTVPTVLLPVLLVAPLLVALWLCCLLVSGEGGEG